MAGNPLIFTSGLILTTAISGATEVVVATNSGVTTRFSGQTIILEGHALITTPGSTATVAMQIRRGSLTGTQIGDHTAQTITAAAGSTNTYDCYATDTPGDVSEFTYVLTATCASGSGAGSCVYGILNAYVI